MLDKFKILVLLILLMSWLSASLEIRVMTLDNPYDRTGVTGNWELHNKYTLQVRLYNNGGSAQNFNRVEANLDFDPAKLDYLSGSDKISGWTATNFFIVSNGHVQYQRAANTGESALTVPAGGYFTLYELYLQVRNTATGPSNAVLDPNFTHALYNITDLTGPLQNLTLTLVNDITPPVTRVIPAGNLDLNQVLSVTLENDPNPNTNCGDLSRIYYTTDGSTPNLGSPVYSGPISLPANLLTTVKWLGVDNDSNPETPHAAVYRVDTIPPVLSNIATVPAEPIRVNKNTTVYISFTATDEVALSSVTVRVGSTDAALVTRNGGNYQYSYLVTESTDGYRTISIQLADHAGNTAGNTSRQIYVDNTPPTFNLDYINPPSANTGTMVEFQFLASEELNIVGSTVNIGTNSPATFVGSDGLHYRFRRVIDGTESSGWIMVYGKDLAGNTGYNLNGNDVLKISGYDLVGNYGETIATMNIKY